MKVISCSAEESHMVHREVVAEKLFRLTLNGRELLTLVSSPHAPDTLIIGFLFLQGLISSTDDIQSIGICPDSGHAMVVIRGDLPEMLQPTLTSGCGGGIVFDNALAKFRLPDRADEAPLFTTGVVLAAMDELNRVSAQYSVHGGIHSAGLSDGKKLLLHAEDIGRHNTIDRLAGSALLDGVEPTGTLLLTSGRISSEMAVKAARLRVAAIASRTSPTDLAVRVCEESQIGLAGYVRGGKMEIYVNAALFGMQL